MPEYLAPGVYVEEVESGLSAISGVSTSTTGFVGSVLKRLDTVGPVKLLLLAILLGSASSVAVEQIRRNYAERLARHVAESFPTTKVSARLADGMAVVVGLVASIFKGSRGDDDDD